MTKHLLDFGQRETIQSKPILKDQKKNLPIFTLFVIVCIGTALTEGGPAES